LCRLPPTPDAILEQLAARPDDLAAWQVLTDFLLETGAPTASLAMCELELLRGISNPDLLEELAAARARREKLPHEPWGGYAAVWRCGFVTRLLLSLQSRADLGAVLRAEPVRALHHLVLSDDSGRFGAPLFATDAEAGAGPLVERLRAPLVAVTPHLRRFSLRLEERYRPVSPPEQRALLSALKELLPSKLERLDLSLGVLHESSQDALQALLARVPLVNLDGTALPWTPGFAEVLQRAGARVCLAGTGLSPRTFEAKEWLAPDVTAWLEREDSGALVPLTAATTPEGFESPAWPDLRSVLRRELEGWSVGEQPLESGAALQVLGYAVTFRQR
jgi:hypothetical protein